MWINLLCDDYTGGRKDGTTYDGIAPFTTPGDVSTPNEAYFARVDAMVRLAAAHGLTVFLDPIETGGWLSTLLRNGVDADYAYGRYIGRRYADFPNIVWLNGNDFEDWRHPEVDAVVLAVARGIQDTDHNHLQTVELNNPESGSLDDKRWRPYPLARRRLHLPPDLRAGAQGVRPQAPPPDLHGRGQLRVRVRRMPGRRRSGVRSTGRC